MASFRKEILGQIERIDTGRIFTFRDLSFETEKTANVAVLLSEQSRKGVLVRVEKGAYYRPKKSVLGLGKLPVYQDEQFRYLTEKLNGYITGAYIYNKMGLTEQVATTITIATPNPVRRFRFKNLDNVRPPMCCLKIEKGAHVWFLKRNPVHTLVPILNFSSLRCV